MPLLRHLRQRTSIKPGPWADLLEYDRSAWSNVEHGHRPASPEVFARCAALLTEHLGASVDPDDLMDAGKGKRRPPTKPKKRGDLRAAS